MIGVSDPVPGTIIFKELEGGDLLAHRCLEKEGMIQSVI